MNLTESVPATAAPKAAKAAPKPKAPAAAPEAAPTPAKAAPAPAKAGPDPITGTDVLNGAKSFGQGTYSRATAGDTKGAILTAVLLTSGSALLAQLVHPKPGGIRPFAKIIVGGFLMGGALTLLAEADPRVAKALGWVITISAILINGQTLFSVVGDTVSPKAGYAIPLNDAAARAAIAAHTAAAVKATAAGHAGTGLGTGNKTQRGKVG